jgi:hypothetical protein
MDVLAVFNDLRAAAPPKVLSDDPPTQMRRRYAGARPNGAGPHPGETTSCVGSIEHDS